MYKDHRQVGKSMLSSLFSLTCFRYTVVLVGEVLVELLAEVLLSAGLVFALKLFAITIVPQILCQRLLFLLLNLQLDRFADQQVYPCSVTGIPTRDLGYRITQMPIDLVY